MWEQELKWKNQAEWTCKQQKVTFSASVVCRGRTYSGWQQEEILQSGDAGRMGSWDSPPPWCRRGGGWGMVWRTPPSLSLSLSLFSHSVFLYVSPSPWYTGALLLTVHFSECNQSVSRSRLNQSLPSTTSTNLWTHSSLISDQNTARICCCLLCTLMRGCTVLWTVII